MRIPAAFRRNRNFDLPTTATGLFKSAEDRLNQADATIEAVLQSNDQIRYYSAAKRSVVDRHNLISVIVSGMSDAHVDALSDATRLRLLRGLNNTLVEYDVRRKSYQSTDRLLKGASLSSAFIAERLTAVEDFAHFIKSDDTIQADRAAWSGYDGFQKAEALNRLFAKLPILSQSVTEIGVFAEPKDRSYVRKTTYEYGQLRFNTHADAKPDDFDGLILRLFSELKRGDLQNLTAKMHHDDFVGEQPELKTDIALLAESERAIFVSSETRKDRPHEKLLKAEIDVLRRTLKPSMLETLAAGLANMAGVKNNSPRSPRA